MFQSPSKIRLKSASHGIGRFAHLQKLVDEFQDKKTTPEEKLQVLANLANFAYDPVNYAYIRRLLIHELFLDMTTETDEKMVEYGMGGICNLSCDTYFSQFYSGEIELKMIIDTANGEHRTESYLISLFTALFFLLKENVETRARISQEREFTRRMEDILSLKQQKSILLSNLVELVRGLVVVQRDEEDTD